MRRFVIVRMKGTQPTFVTNPNSEYSFTPDIRQARRYETREDAERDRCIGNEHVQELEEFLS